MDDLRDLLDREARRVQGTGHGLDAVLRRAERRRQARRIGVAALALAIAVFGSLGVVRAFLAERDRQIPAGPAQDQPFPGIWPETSWEEWEATGESVAEGHQPWRTDAIATAEAYAFHIGIPGVVRATEPRTDHLATAEIVTEVRSGNFTFPTTTLVHLRRLSDAKIWTVIQAETEMMEIEEPQPGTQPLERPIHIVASADTRWPGLQMRGIVEVATEAGPSKALPPPASSPVLPVDDGVFDVEIEMPSATGAPIVTVLMIDDGDVVAFESFRLRSASLSAPSPMPAPSPEGTVTLQVLNGTNVSEVAAGVADKLESAGYEVVSVGNARRAYSRTTLFYRPGARALAEGLAAEYFPGAAVEIRGDDFDAIANSEIAVTIVVGEDYPP